MAESASGNSQDERYILKFKAATGFTVVLEFGGMQTLTANQNKIESAGLQCERIAEFSVNFDEADLFMDMRSPVCASQFDLEDWI